MNPSLRRLPSRARSRLSLGTLTLLAGLGWTSGVFADPFTDTVNASRPRQEGCSTGVNPISGACNPAPDAATMASSRTEQDAQALTTSLLGVLAQYQTALLPSKRRQLLKTLQTLARERKARMVALLHENPAAFLRQALRSDIRQQLPQAVRADIESSVTRQGRLEVRVEDDMISARVLYVLRETTGQRYPLRFAAPPTARLRSGDTVRVAGVELDRQVVLVGGSFVGGSPLGLTVIQSATIRTTGQRRAVVILANFQDRPQQPFTVAQVMNVLTDNEAYYRENSYGKLNMPGTIVGWLTLPMAIGPSGCPTNMILAEAVKAADPQVFFPDYSHISVVFPQLQSCSFGGLATVGEEPHATADGVVTVGVTWINGHTDRRIYSHEFGHNLGRNHANGLDCTEVPIRETGCRSVEYGDPYDTMGTGSGHFNADAKDALGWFDPGQVLTVTPTSAGSVFTVPLLEYRTPGVQALKIEAGMIGGVVPRFYYLEYRQPVGYDVPAPSVGLAFDGALVHSASSVSTQSELLDATPQSQPSTDFRDARLPVGQTLTDHQGITIKTLGLTRSTLTAAIGLGAAQRPPLPDIKANGADGPVTRTTTLPLVLTVALDPGTLAGTPADWWIAASTSGGWYWLRLDGSWVQSDTPIRVYDGPLVSVPPIGILDAQIPPGDYVFYFAVDTTRDDTPNEPIYVDQVQVTVQPAGAIRRRR